MGRTDGILHGKGLEFFQEWELDEYLLTDDVEEIIKLP